MKAMSVYVLKTNFKSLLKTIFENNQRGPNSFVVCRFGVNTIFVSF